MSFFVCLFFKEGSVNHSQIRFQTEEEARRDGERCRRAMISTTGYEVKESTGSVNYSFPRDAARPLALMEE